MTEPEKKEDLYERIGVRPFINCCGTRTIHSGTLMLPCVKRAMMAAADRFVNMDELMTGVGKRLGELTGAEWGIATAGSAAALSHVTAACVSGGDPEKLLRLPDVKGLKDRVLMPRGGRFTYDHAIRGVGVEIVEVGNREELVGALDERVAMVALLGTHEGGWFAELEELVEIARLRNVPVVVDAASEHLRYPEPYLARGAAMVAYSGGKYLRGPQPSGLLLGEKRWVEAAWVAASPHHTLGRGMKVGKEEVMGVLAAVEYWAAEREEEGEKKQWEADLERIAGEVTLIEGVAAERLESETEKSPVPRLQIRWDGERIGVNGLELRERLLAGSPRIMLDDRGATGDSVFILPFSLQPGEAELVGAKIREVLESAPERRVEEPGDPFSVEGDWELEIEYCRGVAIHRVTIEREGQVLAGIHRTLFLSGCLEGRVRGNEIAFESLHRFEGTHLAYRFLGTAMGDVMGGTVELGSEGQSAPGPLNRREYGMVSWRGKRVVAADPQRPPL